MIDCTQAYHNQLKADRELFVSSTQEGYWQPDTEELVECEFRHCLWCKSSISDGTTRPLRTEHVLLEEAAA